MFGSRHHSDVTIESMGRLLLAGSRGRPDVLVHRGPRPPRSLEDGADSALWACEPLETTGSTVEALWQVLWGALVREQAILGARLHPPASHPVVRVHRTPGPSRGSRRLGSWVRSATGGVLIEYLPDGHDPTALDLVMQAAGVDTARPVRLRPTRGSGAIGLVTHDAEPAVLRVALPGTAGDPSTAVPALERLRGTADLVPRLLAGGTTAGLRWTLESRLPGRPAADGSGAALAVRQQVAALWRQLPGSGEWPSAAIEDLLWIGFLLPSSSHQLQAVARALRPRELPSVFRHGDLWSANVLVHHGRVTGLVDWGSWHDRGVPGADLLHLVAMSERRPGETIADVWMRRPWTWRAVHDLVGPELHRHGLRPDDELLHRVAIAWWTTLVAGTLQRLPHRARDQAWIAQTVTPVLDDLVAAAPPRATRPTRLAS